MFTDDENPEGGEFHEINGRRYSVVGNKVYIDGLFGWQLVEDEDEQASAGDIREVNGHTYSLVGDTVYCKNWLGGWDEVSDIEERAEAGDLQEARGSTYSRVGNTIYQKGLFGWEQVTDEDEEADAGDKREVGSMVYSLVGDTVYRKDLFGWIVVDDDDECAEAGDHYVRHNTTYSRIGDVVYKKELFGWTKLTEEVDEDGEEETEISTPSYSRQEHYYSSSRDTSKDNDDAGGAWIKWLFYIALFVGAVWLVFVIVLPLMLLNAALILLTCGLIWKQQSKILYGAAIAGIIYLLADIYFEGLSNSLIGRAAFFQELLAICVYLNIAASLIAAYLLFRTPPIAQTSEFSRRNLILSSVLAISGTGLVLVNIFALQDRHSASTQVTPVYTVPAPVTTAPATPQPAPIQAVNTADSAKMDSARAVTAPVTASLQLDTNQIKADLIGKIGNLQYSDQLFDVNQILSVDIRDRVNDANGITFEAYLTLTKNRNGQVEMTYLYNNGSLSLATARLLKMRMNVTVPADEWGQFRALVGFNMRLLDDSRMYWKAFEAGQVYETGADVGPVTLPSSNQYLVKSRGDGPLVVGVEFTPAN